MPAIAISSGSHRRTVSVLALVVVGMFGFGFALVPLYDVLCRVAGIQRVAAAAPAAIAGDDAAIGARRVTVKFDGTVSDGLPWAFRPLVARMDVDVGEVAEARFLARNLSDAAVTGQAIPGVVPWQATEHFQKTECFCFGRQTLGPGESKEMVLRFRVSPALPEGTDSLRLSYTFMRADAEAAPGGKT